MGRPAAELARWQERDPLTIFARLAQEGLLDEQQATELGARVAARIEDVVERRKASPEPGPEAMFRHIYAPAT